MTGSVAVVAEAGLDLGPASAIVKRVARDLPVVALLPDGSDASLAAAASAKPDRVVVISDGPAPLLAETAAAALEEVCRREGAELVALPATVRWREVAAQLGFRLGGGCTTEVLDLRRGEEGALLADRLLYGGLVVATLALRAPAVVTLDVPVTTEAAIPVEPVPVLEAVAPEGSKRLLDRKRLAPEAAEGEEAERPTDLSTAGRIVAVGRGLRQREDLSLIENLAAVLGAEIACTRPITDDLGWLPEERKVGLSGRVVKPTLYVAVGISGAIQHLVGMRDSGVIVAINSDPRAPIFQAADFGVVGDLYEVIPGLTAALAAKARTVGT
jgi:electron transfer flavoprotein alpha subunit